MSQPPEGMVKRRSHIAATLSFIEEFYEVVLFGGFYVFSMNKTRIIRFGKCDINQKNAINLVV